MSTTCERATMLRVGCMGWLTQIIEVALLFFISRCIKHACYVSCCLHKNLAWVPKLGQVGVRMQNFKITIEGGFFIIPKVDNRILLLLVRPLFEKLSILVETSRFLSIYPPKGDAEHIQ